MRLIDAETLIEFLEQKRKEWFDLDIGASCAYDIAKQAVEGAETVEAIPIDWLNNLIEHYRENGWHDDAEDLELLINDWREEQKNETD